MEEEAPSNYQNILLSEDKVEVKVKQPIIVLSQAQEQINQKLHLDDEDKANRDFAQPFLDLAN